MFKIKNLAIFVAMIVFASCSDQEGILDSKFPENGPFMFGDSEVNKIIYDQSYGPISAYQILFKDYGVHNLGQDNSGYGDNTVDALYAIYRVDDRAEFITYSKCNGLQLTARTGEFPHRYLNEFEPAFASPGDTLNWEFKHPYFEEPINTFLLVPQDFGNLTTNVEYLDITQGCTITWDNPDDGDLALYVSMAYMTPDRDPMGGVYSYFVDFIPNNGSFNVTPEFIQNYLDKPDSLLINVSLRFAKFRTKVDKFFHDFNVATTVIIEKAIAMPTFQD